MNTNSEITNDLVDLGVAELSSDDLETVSGGRKFTETSFSYDTGWVLSAIVKQVYDFGRGVYDGITDDES